MLFGERVGRERLARDPLGAGAEEPPARSPRVSAERGSIGGSKAFGTLGVGHTNSIGDQDGVMPPLASFIYAKPK